jgi:hypothetical protein
MQTVGIILVHGIGEQRRFEHLDGQTRLLLDALRLHPDVDEVSVDIRNLPGRGRHLELGPGADGDHHGAMASRCRNGAGDAHRRARGLVG